ncbi:MAG: response regulator transcription factor [Clostridia bacterium]|nr:response regulator transcription factor [Clostridia bacterium]
MNKKVLVAEDEQAIREFIVINLKRAGYETIEAADGLEALEQYENCNGEIAVALLDIIMPNMNGLEVCKKLREKNKVLGIMMLTAKTQEMDKVSGLLNGADDYVTKPFSPSELMARVDAIYRRVAMLQRSTGDEDNSLVQGRFSLNAEKMTFTKNDIPVDLTQVEFQIMNYFFQNQGKTLSRTQILHKVWGESREGEEKIVDVNIRRIRKKIEDEPSVPKHLLTIWGMGYKWVG